MKTNCTSPFIPYDKVKVEKKVSRTEIRGIVSELRACRKELKEHEKKIESIIKNIHNHINVLDSKLDSHRTRTDAEKKLFKDGDVDGVCAWFRGLGY